MCLPLVIADGDLEGMSDYRDGFCSLRVSLLVGRTAGRGPIDTTTPGAGLPRQKEGGVTADQGVDRQSE